MSETRWRLYVDTEPRSGAENMAIDDALLREAGGGIASFRLYRWDPPCLSFGRNEPALTRYDKDRIAALGLDTVRRPTGGRAVWHDREITYALAAPINVFGTLRESYGEIHAVLARALRSLGVDADLAQVARGRTPSLKAGACFAAPVGGEVTVRGKKLVGSAQVRESDAFLQHGSILLEDGQDLVQQITVGQQSPMHTTSLKDELNRVVSFDEVADSITQEIKAAWIGKWDRKTDSPTGLSRDKFGTSEWTWRR
ncbi:MAG: lipoate--protein ligase family protein [Gemmatimonadota bacterium]|nr:lipoate--protein ligase family protein [Gemmatimonadota bacterium]MDH5806056.1 lipoate--protein ligase family protein [Gemmatimonadota bacterium]